MEINNNQLQRNVSIGETSASTLRIHFGRHKIRKLDKKIDNAISNGYLNGYNNNGNLSPNLQLRDLLAESPLPDSFNLKNHHMRRFSIKAPVNTSKISLPAINMTNEQKFSTYGVLPTTKTSLNSSRRVFKYSASSAALLDANTHLSMRSLLNHTKPIPIVNKQSTVSGIDTSLQLTNVSTSSNFSLAKSDLESNASMIEHVSLFF